MYNLNVNVSTTASGGGGGNMTITNLLAVESACTTPRTPEILNSLIAMTNPLDNYGGGGGGKVSANKNQCANNDDSNSSSSTTGPAGSSSPPSVQHTCSQLIKAGLKLSIESKRKHLDSDESLLDLDSVSSSSNNNNTQTNGGVVKRVKKMEEDDDRSQSPNLGLTIEDEERRRRRRERNKIAATKCRLKKREKTVILVHESEILETQNVDLKTQIQELESQRRRLVDVLTLHTPSCIKQTTEQQQQQQQDDEQFILADDDDDDVEIINNNHHHHHHDPLPIILIDGDGDSYSPGAHQLTDLDNTTYQFHQNYNGAAASTGALMVVASQNYNNTTTAAAVSAMDNGCMA